MSTFIVMAAKRTGKDGKTGVLERMGAATVKTTEVCYHWRAGRCNRHPCHYLHHELPSVSGNGAVSRRLHGLSDDRGFSGSRYVRRGNSLFNPNVRQQSLKWVRGHDKGEVETNVPLRTQDKVCNYWIKGSCVSGDKCRYLHSWFRGDCFSMLAQLEGHQKLVSGIALPSGSNKLYSASKDESVRIWDCETGQCASVINLGDEIGCIIKEGLWIFVGIINAVKAWNTETAIEVSLSGPVGQVYALVVGNDMLIAGTQDGTILAWKSDAVGKCFLPATSLRGHSLPVVSLVVGAGMLYSGSMDRTVRSLLWPSPLCFSVPGWSPFCEKVHMVWELENLQCIRTLNEHTSVVTSVICWDDYLLSSSLDHTIKVWACTESGKLDVVYTHNEEHGVLMLCGIHDAEAKPILLCSCEDNSVRLYDLPTFAERGRIFAKQEVRAIDIGPGGLFFTGDGTGQVTVWKLLDKPSSTGA